MEENNSKSENSIASEMSRMPAKKVRISDITNGKYFFSNVDQKKVAYVITTYGQRLSRVNIVATVIDKFLNEDESYCTLTLDDGTGVVKVKAFKEEARSIAKFELGDLVLTIGKLREYTGEVYVAGEAIRKLNDAKFEQVRRLELLNKMLVAKRIVDELRAIHENSSLDELKEIAAKKFDLDEEQLNVVIENLNTKKEIDYKPAVMEIISELDSGKGVEMHRLFEQSNLPENIVESTINDLLAEGTLFEPLPGILKKV